MTVYVVLWDDGSGHTRLCGVGADLEAAKEVANKFELDRAAADGRLDTGRWRSIGAGEWRPIRSTSGGWRADGYHIRRQDVYHLPGTWV